MTLAARTCSGRPHSSGAGPDDEREMVKRGSAVVLASTRGMDRLVTLVRQRLHALVLATRISTTTRPCATMPACRRRPRRPTAALRGLKPTF